MDYPACCLRFAPLAPTPTPIVSTPSACQDRGAHSASASPSGSCDAKTPLTASAIASRARASARRATPDPSLISFFLVRVRRRLFLAGRGGVTSQFLCCLCCLEALSVPIVGGAGCFGAHCIFGGRAWVRDRTRAARVVHAATAILVLCGNAPILTHINAACGQGGVRGRTHALAPLGKSGGGAHHKVC